MGDGQTESGHVKDLAPAYALGALEPTERERVERHRRVCPACDRLLTSKERAVSLLPFLVRATPPPSPDVKVALLARVAQNHRPNGPGWSTDYAALPPTLTIPASRPVPAPAVSRAGLGAGGRRDRRAGWATALLAAPLLLAVALLGTLAVQFHAQAAERGARAESFGATLEQALDGGGSVHRLLPGLAAPEAKGWVVADAKQLSATFHMKADKARAGERYRLFARADGSLVALATVELDGRGRGADALDLDRPLSAYRDLIVKRLRPGEERAGGPALWGVVATPAGAGSATPALPSPD